MSKGSRDRTKDHKAYRESLDRVFGSRPKTPTNEELWKMMSTVYPATTDELMPVKDKNLNDGDEVCKRCIGGKQCDSCDAYTHDCFKERAEDEKRN